MSQPEKEFISPELFELYLEFYEKGQPLQGRELFIPFLREF